MGTEPMREECGDGFGEGKVARKGSVPILGEELCGGMGTDPNFAFGFEQGEGDGCEIRVSPHSGQVASRRHERERE